MVRFSVTWYLVQVPHICLLLADVGFAIVGPSEARTVIPSGAREPYLFHKFDSESSAARVPHPALLLR
jgi:hypothetical protein